MSLMWEWIIAAPGEVFRAWVIQITVGLSEAAGGQEHWKDSGARMEGSFADGRRQQENRKGRWQMA